MAHRADLDERAAERATSASPNSTTRATVFGHLEVAEVIGRVEAVERALAQLVEVEVVPLLGVGVLGDAVDAGVRLRADDVVDDAAELAQLVDVVDFVAARRRAPSCSKPRDMPR